MYIDKDGMPTSNMSDLMENMGKQMFKCIIMEGKPKPICKIPNIPDNIEEHTKDAPILGWI